MVRVFVGHSSHDTVLAEKLTVYLRDVFGMNRGEVFCSSSHSIPGGTNFDVAILDALKEAEIHIFIITPGFLSSTYCVAEWGAAWVLEKKNVFCFYQHPISPTDERVPTFFRSIQSVVIGDRVDRDIVSFMKNITEKISGLDSRFAEAKYAEACRDEYNALINFMACYQPVIPIALNNPIVFHHPQEVSSRTLRLRDHDQDNAIRLDVDFVTDKPNYVGCAIPLMNKNWASYYHKALSFNLYVNKSISGVTLELKGESQKIIFKKYIETTLSTQKCEFKLSEMSSTPSGLQDMTELVFVLNKDDVDGVGTIIISKVLLEG